MPTCWDGIEMSLDLINEKRIKLVVNGGCLNPKGLAEKTHELVRINGFRCVGCIDGSRSNPKDSI